MSANVSYGPWLVGHAFCHYESRKKYFFSRISNSMSYHEMHCICSLTWVCMHLFYICIWTSFSFRESFCNHFVWPFCLTDSKKILLRIQYQLARSWTWQKWNHQHTDQPFGARFACHMTQFGYDGSMYNCKHKLEFNQPKFCRHACSFTWMSPLESYPCVFGKPVPFYI